MIVINVKLEAKLWVDLMWQYVENYSIEELLYFNHFKHLLF